MKIGAAFPSKYLKADDLQGRSIQVQIAGLHMEDVGNEQKPESKLVLYMTFQGRACEKPMILNRTNADTIAMDLGDETDTWIGHTIELFSARVQGPNGLTNGIRLRVIHAQHGTAPMPTVGQALPHYAPVGLTPTGNIQPSSAFKRQEPPPATQGDGGAFDSDIPF